MSVAIQGMTTRNTTQALKLLKMLMWSDAGTGYMHESVKNDEQRVFTRPWFSEQPPAVKTQNKTRPTHLTLHHIPHPVPRQKNQTLFWGGLHCFPHRWKFGGFFAVLRFAWANALFAEFVLQRLDDICKAPPFGEEATNVPPETSRTYHKMPDMRQRGLNPNKIWGNSSNL
eukprot:3660993-Amphidinium_carterae.1